MEQPLCRLILLLGVVNLAFGQISDRIVGGEDGNIQHYPWQVSLWFDSRHVCGATIISPTAVLTAAHCVPSEHKDTDYQVIAGTTSLSNTDPLTQTVGVDRCFRNPSYTSEGYSFDIAVVKLKAPLTFNNNVQPIRLPAANVQIPAGFKCKITGWGHIQQSQPLKQPQTLQVGQVTIISQKTCNCLYKINPTDNTISSINQDMICAGTVDGSVDACQGDSGGPLSCYTNGNWYQIGVVSWGEECGAPNKPGVFTLITANINWIQSLVPDALIDNFVVDATPVPDQENGCKAADGTLHPYPNSGSMVLITLAMLPLYWLSAYFLTDL
ncbi:prostasin [Leptodactylus fuscus]|uniref:prostasin n=1 Tax=Leptodactylus fuscus TaxID=238119 RepID=UPI003F4F1D8E